MNDATFHAELRDVGTLDRTSYVGGSDIAAIAGVDPYRTAMDVYLQKIGEAPPPRPDPKGDARKRRGKLWEPIVVQMLEEDHGIRVVKRNARYVDATLPYCAAEIDFEWTRPESSTVINGEIKTVHPLAAGRFGEAESGDVPVEMAAQSQWGLGITGRDLCQYGVVFGADDLTLYHVWRDDEVIAWLREEAQRFWEQHVLPRVPPPPRTIADARRRWPGDTTSRVEADGALEALYRTWQTLTETRRRAADGLEAVEFEIATAVKDATTVTRDGEPWFTYRPQQHTSIRAAELKAAYPDVYKQFARTSEYRVLRQSRKPNHAE